MLNAELFHFNCTFNLFIFSLVFFRIFHLNKIKYNDYRDFLTITEAD